MEVYTSACLNNVDKVFWRAIALTFDELERRLEQAIGHLVSVNKAIKKSRVQIPLLNNKNI